MAMTLRLTDEDERALALLAEAQGISKQEATVRAIRDAAGRRVHEDRVSELSTQARARYADVLERLVVRPRNNKVFLVHAQGACCTPVGFR